jgi:hypothetical protein
MKDHRAQLRGSLNCAGPARGGTVRLERGRMANPRGGSDAGLPEMHGVLPRCRPRLSALAWAGLVAALGQAPTVTGPYRRSGGQGQRRRVAFSSSTSRSRRSSFGRRNRGSGRPRRWNLSAAASPRHGADFPGSVAGTSATVGYLVDYAWVLTPLIGRARAIPNWEKK